MLWYIARIFYYYICCLLVQMLPDQQKQYSEIFLWHHPLRMTNVIVSRAAVCLQLAEHQYPGQLRGEVQTKETL